MDAGVLNFIGSLLGGVGEAKKAKQKQEEAKPMQEIQKQLLKLKLEEAKGNAKMMDMAQQYFTQQQTEKASKDLAEPVKPEKYETQFGDSFNLGTPEGSEQINKGSELLNAIVGGRGAGGQIPPIMAAFVGGRTGIDLLGAGRLEEQRKSLSERARHNLNLEGMAQKKFEVTRDKVTSQPITIGGVPHIQRYNYKGDKIGKPVRTGDKKALPGETASKLALAKSGLKDIVSFKRFIFNKDGSVDRKTLFEMVTRFPFSKGRTAASFADNAIETKLRIESGAAVPKEEVTRMASRFRPQVLDSDDLIKEKVSRMESFLAGTVSLYDPNKRYTKDIEIFKTTDGKTFVVEPGKQQKASGKVDFKFNPKTGKLEPVT